MADAGTFCTTAQAAVKAGDGANTTAVTEAEVNKHVIMVESFINAYTRYNWHDVYASLNADVKYILADIASNLCAIYIINYDMSGYSSTREAESMINVLRDRAMQGLGMLRDKEVQRFINGA